jgi:hypothetical protein
VKEITMKSSAAFVALAMLAVTTSTPVFAGHSGHASPCDHQNTTNAPAADGFDYGMQEVLNTATPESPAHGWRYFSDPKALRAVVISPQGDYYFSQGNGLQWIAAEHT